MATTRVTTTGLSISDLPPNIFAIVMATGIVSLAAAGNNWRLLAWCLFGVNTIVYVVLWACLLVRLAYYRERLLTDYFSHAKAPGYFTLVAGTCVLGNQFVLLAGLPAAGQVLGSVGLTLWCGLTYTVLPCLMSADKKPQLEQSISGAWLLTVVGTQAVSVSAAIVAPSLSADWRGPGVFLALSFWLAGSMLYIWLISLIFYRIVFLPLPASDLTPPYWINMGAMAISTLAGVSLVRTGNHLPLLAELLPFVKGLTLMFWATATWWIPLLFMLGIWRHIQGRFPLDYEHGYWAAVFPLGMYTVCTQRMGNTFELPFLRPIAVVFAWIAVAAWIATFAGLLLALARKAGALRARET